MYFFFYFWGSAACFYSFFNFFGGRRHEALASKFLAQDSRSRTEESLAEQHPESLERLNALKPK